MLFNVILVNYVYPVIFVQEFNETVTRIHVTLKHRNQFTQDFTHGPLATQDLEEREGHTDDTQGHVREGEVDDEEVAGGVHLGSSRYDKADHYVGEQTCQYQQGVDHYERVLRHLHTQIEVIINNNNNK